MRARVCRRPARDAGREQGRGGAGETIRRRAVRGSARSRRRFPHPEGGQPDPDGRVRTPQERMKTAVRLRQHGGAGSRAKIAAGRRRAVRLRRLAGRIMAEADDGAGGRGGRCRPVRGHAGRQRGTRRSGGKSLQKREIAQKPRQQTTGRAAEGRDSPPAPPISACALRAPPQLSPPPLALPAPAARHRLLARWCGGDRRMARLLRPHQGAPSARAERPGGGFRRGEMRL